MTRPMMLLVASIAAGCKDAPPGVDPASEPLATLSALRDAICGCKDQPCVDAIDAAMRPIARSIDERSRNGAFTQLDATQLHNARLAYDRCRALALETRAGSAAPAPPPDTVPAAIGTPALADQVLAAARAWNAQRPGQMFVGMKAWWVAAEGVIDERHGQVEISFGRSSAVPDDPARKTGAPVPSVGPQTCDGWSWKREYKGWWKLPRPCPDAVVYNPTCTVAAIWQRAIARGAPADALAYVELHTMSATTPAHWAFAIDDDPRGIHVRESFPDDCPLAVEKP